jgi:hypothetical protein
MRRTTLSLVAFAAALLTMPRAAHAQAYPACRSLPGHLVYVESGDTQENLLKVLGRQLRDQANVTLVFHLTGSCTITSDLYAGALMTPGGNLMYIPSTAENAAWTPTDEESYCVADNAGQAIDVGIAALFVQTCGLGGPPAGSSLALIQGPVQAYTFVVPTASSQRAIWAEEAYYAFGFGDANRLTPWNDEAFMFIRPPSKSTLLATAFNILVPPDKWHGVPESLSTDVANAVAVSPNVEPTIGILGAEVYDADRGAGIKTLAYRAYGQHHAYYPDSSATSFDRKNVRDGHYTLWSPTEYMTRVDGTGAPVNSFAAYFIDLVLGVEGAASPDGGAPIDGLADVVSVGLVPDCAMGVTRTGDGAPLSLYTPATPCGCYFAAHVPGVAPGTIPAGCSTCAGDATCGGGKCRHGFCEGQ